jgi:hypothetical protein
MRSPPKLIALSLRYRIFQWGQGMLVKRLQLAKVNLELLNLEKIRVSDFGGGKNQLKTTLMILFSLAKVQINENQLHGHRFLLILLS